MLYREQNAVELCSKVIEMHALPEMPPGDVVTKTK